MQRFQLYYQGGENRWSLHFEWTSDKRVCWWPPMFANQQCYTYIPWTPSTFLRSHCLIGLSFSWNVRLDSFVSLPGSLSERQSGVAQTSERETFWTPSEGWNFFFREREKRSPDASRVICSPLVKASVNGVLVSHFTGNSSCSEVG